MSRQSGLTSTRETNSRSLPTKEDDLDDIPEIAKRLSILPQMPRTDWAIETGQWRNILQAYLDSVSFADDQVGRVLDALAASPYAEDTIVVLWSDHGYHIGEKNTFQKHSGHKCADPYRSIPFSSLHWCFILEK
jgi:arylsulfatase A-like enzyme